MFKNILKWLASHFLRHSLIATKKQKLPFDLRNKVLRHFTRTISFINYCLLIPFNFIACSERASLLWRTVRHSFFSGVGLSETLLYMVTRLVFGNIARNKKNHAVESIIKYWYLRQKSYLFLENNIWIYTLGWATVPTELRWLHHLLAYVTIWRFKYSVKLLISVDCLVNHHSSVV